MLLDMLVAYNLGAPMGHTLSSYAYALSQKGHPFGVLTHTMIDSVVRPLGERHHCQKAHKSAMERIKKYGPH